VLPVCCTLFQDCQVDFGSIDSLDTTDVAPPVLGVVGVESVAAKAPNGINDPVAVHAATSTGGLIRAEHPDIVACQSNCRRRALQQSFVRSRVEQRLDSIDVVEFDPYKPTTRVGLCVDQFGRLDHRAVDSSHGASQWSDQI